MSSSLEHYNPYYDKVRERSIRGGGKATVLRNGFREHEF